MVHPSFRVVTLDCQCWGSSSKGPVCTGIRDITAVTETSWRFLQTVNVRTIHSSSGWIVWDLMTDDLTSILARHLLGKWRKVSLLFSVCMADTIGCDFHCGQMLIKCHIVSDVQCESKNAPPPLQFSDIFAKWLGIPNKFSRHLLYVAFYTRLQIFIQLFPTLTKLCHTKRDHQVIFFYISLEL